MGSIRSRVRVVSPTIQEFAGVRYYRCGDYFQRKGVRLHRVVWEAYRGPIPKGHEIHHRDRNRAHNHIGNLRCLPISEDRSRHMRRPEVVKRSRRLVRIAQQAARRWHSLPAGRQWHREQWHRHCAPALRRLGRMT